MGGETVMRCACDTCAYRLRDVCGTQVGCLAMGHLVIEDKAAHVFERHPTEGCLWHERGRGDK